MKVAKHQVSSLREVTVVPLNYHKSRRAFLQFISHITFGLIDWLLRCWSCLYRHAYFERCDSSSCRFVWVSSKDREAILEVHGVCVDPLLSDTRPHIRDFLSRNGVISNGLYRGFFFLNTPFHYDASMGRFLPTSHPSVSDLNCNSLSGLRDKERQLLLTIFGPNRLYIEVKSIMTIALDTIISPFYVFQFISVISWIHDNYYAYAGVVVLISVVSLVCGAYQEQMQLKKLQHSVSVESEVIVLDADSRPRSLTCGQCVPFDLAVIVDPGHEFMFDCVIVDGGCLVDESALTGESTPVPRFPLDADCAEVESSRWKNSTIYAGSKVVCISFGLKQPLVLVTASGYLSMKGSLVASLLYRSTARSGFFEDVWQMFAVLAIIAAVGFTYSVRVLLKFDLSWDHLLVRAFDLVTVIVPPALPALLSIGVLRAVSRLQPKGIACSDFSRIFSGSHVDVMCFDKTGTLTEDQYHVEMFVAISDCGQLQNHDNPRTLPLSVARSLATCHALFPGVDTIHGDPMERSLLAFVDWSMEVCLNSRLWMHPRLQHSIPSVVMKYFFFDPELRRMSTVVQTGDDLVVVVKGAPEEVVTLCKESSLPENLGDVLAMFTSVGHRALAYATKKLTHPVNLEKLHRQDVENDLNFQGFAILSNKFKPGGFKCVSELAEANIPVVMITGDNLQTSLSVGRQCGILDCSKGLVVLNADSDVGCLEDATAMLAAYSKAATVVAITGDTAIYLRDHDYSRFQTLLPTIKIFARTSPVQKRVIVEELQLLGFCVGMCGDGANDCEALKVANMGLAMTSAHASLAAPFTCLSNDVRAVCDVIRESRASLVMSYSCLRYMVLYSFLQFSAVVLLYTFGLSFSDYQWVLQDLVLIIPFSSTLEMAGTTKKLSLSRPDCSLYTWRFIIPLLAQVFLAGAFQVIAVMLIQSMPWYTPTALSLNHDGDLAVGGYETYAVFFTLCFQYITMTLLCSPGPPHCARVTQNRWFLVNLAISTALLLVIFFGRLEFVDWILEFAPTPTWFTASLMLLVAAHAVIAWIIDKKLLGHC